MQQNDDSASGLEYLVRAGKLKAPRVKRSAISPSDSEPSVPSPLSAFAARALLLEIQSQEESGQRRKGVLLSELADSLGMSGEALIPLARTLRDRGLVSLTDESTFGDGQIKLSAEGRKLVTQKNLAELLHSVGLD
jgi:hypothetical protein